MPRKRRCSARSSVSNKSPRKSNLNASSASADDNGNTTNVEGKNYQLPISVTIDGEEWTWNPHEELACLSGEESECENKKPTETEALQGQALPTNSACSSPLKRVSPLSPTLCENVVPISPIVAIPSLEPDPNVTAVPIHSPKIEVVEASPFLNTGTPEARSTRIKRRRIFSDSISKVKSPSENETSNSENHVQQKPTESIDSKQESKKCQEITSQKPTESGDKISLPVADFRILDNYHITDAPPPDQDQYRKYAQKTKAELCREVLYELDEMDVCWLELFNKTRAERCDGLNLGDVECKEMELLMDRFEKEHYFELQNEGMGQPGESDEDAVCCICLDGESDNSNQIIFCDMCNIPVHQDCFGVPFIPEGIWLCRRCSISPNADIECIFCPNKDGAFKQTIDGRWSHVLCALWIPEVRFANPSLVEPVDDIEDIPAARWKLTCFLCKKKGVGACIQCHLRSCVTAFHATCAQAAGLSLKLETKSATDVRMRASCDKHTSVRDMDTLKQKIETINKVLDEKRSAPPEMQFPSLSLDCISAISELVTFPGKLIFIKRLLSYWKLKRKSRGGAPLLRNLESLWCEDMKKPPSAPMIERQHDPNLVESLFGKMKDLQIKLAGLRDYFGLIKSHSEIQREDQNLKFKEDSIKLENFYSAGVHLYLDILTKLGIKDKFKTFAEPVTDDDAPDYSKRISTPMDLSTMKGKSLRFEYSTIDELEADFNLMIANCMTYNKKSTPYYRDAVKLQDYGKKLFEEGRRTLEEQLMEENVDTATIPDASFLKTDDSDDNENSSSYREVKFNPLQEVLNNIIEQLAKHDKNGVFAEPVDVNELPDYLTIIKKPMDFSTMKNKISSNQYSCIEDLEVDYFLMINNCIEYNDEKSKFYKLAQRLNELGKSVFEEEKHKRYIPSELTTTSISKVMITENNNNYKTDVSTNDLEEPRPFVKFSDEDIRNLMTDVLKELFETDEEEIFTEPVSDEDAPGYSDVIKCPMDLSLMEKNLKLLLYTSLDDMEKDFILMIDNCKKYNSGGTKYYNYATKMRRAGHKIFNAARKQLSRGKNPQVDTKL